MSVPALLLLTTSAARGLEVPPPPEISGGGALAGVGVDAAAMSTSSLLPSPPPPEPAPPVVGTTFDGFGFDDNPVENGGTYFIPPDPIGAAGSDRLVAVVNAMIEARTKAGALLWRDALAGFFAPLTPANALFDPKVIYDHYEGRFVVVALERVEPGIANPSAGNVSRVLLAVSKTATPATATSADWYYTAVSGKFSIGGLDYWSDYPGFEVDEEAVYITNNLFLFAPASGFGGTRLWIVHKGVVGGFYGGGAATVTVHDPYASGGIAATTMPCQVYGAGGVGPGIGTFLVSYSSLTAGGVGAPEFAQVVRVDSPLGAVTFAQEFVSLGDLENVGGGFGFPPLPDAPQLGTATPVEVNDTRALDCVWRAGRIWFTTTINPNAGPDTGQTTAHWVRLDTSAVPAPITLSDQGNIGGEDIAAGTYTYYPALAVNTAGNAMFGFAASAATIYPGAYLTGREAGDGAGTVQASQTVHAGMDFYVRTFGMPRNRWGDYSGMALDPADDAAFWAFNEYAATRGTSFGGEDGRWGTAWGRATFSTGTTTTSTSTSSTTSSSTSSTTSSSTSSSTSTSTSTTSASTSTSSSTTTLPPPLCGPSPLAPGSCRLITIALKGSVQLKDNVDDAKDLVKWKWKNGVDTALGDFKDPIGGSATMQFCVYDGSGSSQPRLAAQLLPGGTCGAKPCWKASGTTGFVMTNKAATPEGLTKAKFKAGTGGKPQVQVQGKGLNVAMPALPLITPVVAQLLIDDGVTTECWQTTFSTSIKNDALQFKAKGP